MAKSDWLDTGRQEIVIARKLSPSGGHLQLVAKWESSEPRALFSVIPNGPVPFQNCILLEKICEKKPTLFGGKIKEHINANEWLFLPFF